MTAPQSHGFIRVFYYNRMKQLQEDFIGRGEVKGFRFTQIKKNQYGYIYEVIGNGFKHYEVFKHKENKQFNCVSYPSSKSFGLWAWTYRKLEDARFKLSEIELKEVMNYEQAAKS